MRTIASEVHVAGRTANDRARQHIVSTLRGLGLETEVQDPVGPEAGQARRGRRWHPGDPGGRPRVSGGPRPRNDIVFVLGPPSTGRVCSSTARSLLALARALARALGAADIPAPRADGDATYFPVPAGLVSYPALLIWPLAALALLAVGPLGWLARRGGRTHGRGADVRALAA
ncbi:hypothetical protein [Micromonospora sp. NPDC049679]|uniref:hypothetical protein n=1 Tax=Micromonospora sp. NPDC049679 TaxID=3155920 RepID=UPI0033FE4004